VSERLPFHDVSSDSHKGEKAVFVEKIKTLGKLPKKTMRAKNEMTDR
jgi:hypothetical protein